MVKPIHSKLMPPKLGARKVPTSRFGIKDQSTSYFASCERDKQGHCLPSGQAGESGSEDEQDSGSDDEPKLKRKARTPEKLIAAEWKVEKDAKGKVVSRTLILSNGEPIPPHLEKVPATWTNIQVSMNPDDDLWGTGEILNKRKEKVVKPLYNPTFLAENADAKWYRTREGLMKMDEMADEIQSALKSNDEKTRELAAVAWLIQEQGTRPGSEGDKKGTARLFGHPITKTDVLIDKTEKILKSGPRKGQTDTKYSVKLKVDGEEVPIRDERSVAEIVRRVKAGEPLYDSTFWLKSHGATTLEPRHLVERDDGLHLEFMGKESIWNNHLIRDPKLADELRRRMKTTEKGGQLFPINEAQLLKFVHKLDGGDFTPKDLRTQRATKEAIGIIDKMDPPKNQEEFEASIQKVCEQTSKLLGNTPVMAYSNYIDPITWNKWAGWNREGVKVKSLEPKGEPDGPRTYLDLNFDAQFGSDPERNWREVLGDEEEQDDESPEQLDLVNRLVGANPFGTEVDDDEEDEQPIDVEKDLSGAIDTKGEGQPCQQGETVKQSNCIAADGHSDDSQSEFGERPRPTTRVAPSGQNTKQESGLWLDENANKVEHAENNQAFTVELHPPERKEEWSVHQSSVIKNPTVDSIAEIVGSLDDSKYEEYKGVIDARTGNVYTFRSTEYNFKNPNLFGVNHERIARALDIPDGLWLKLEYHKDRESTTGFTAKIGGNPERYIEPRALRIALNKVDRLPYLVQIKLINEFDTKRLNRDGIETGHKFGCLMLKLPDSVCKSITDWTLEHVPDFHLGPGGRELSPHVTVAYGFSPDFDQLDALRGLLVRNGPLSITLTGVSAFTAGYGKWTNTDGDVLKADVDSDALHQLRAQIEGNFDLPGNKFPNYVPHVSLAYIDPLVIGSYVDLVPEFLPLTVEITEAIWSGADGIKEMIPLTFLPQFGVKELCTPGHTRKRDNCTPVSGSSQSTDHPTQDSTAKKPTPKRKPLKRPTLPRDARTAQTQTPQTPEQKLEVQHAEYKKLGTRAPAFKAWFGDWESDPENASKVVDEDGSPKETYKAKIVFHGRSRQFDEFDSNRIGENGLHAGKGFYFAEDRRVAKKYKSEGGDLLEVYLAIKNPFDLHSIIKMKDVKRLVQFATELSSNFDRAKFDRKIQLTLKYKYGLYGNTILWALSDAIGGDPNHILNAAGYDGIVHNSGDVYGSIGREEDKEYGRIWVAFAPTQIKRVDNEGSFDPSNPAMRKMLATKTYKEGTDSSGRHYCTNDGVRVDCRSKQETTADAAVEQAKPIQDQSKTPDSSGNLASRALSTAGAILKAGIKVPAEVLSKAKQIGTWMMDKIEQRYGKKTKAAVAAAVLLSLPVPVPGMSVIAAAPVIAYAELYRQLWYHEKADVKGEFEGIEKYDYPDEAAARSAKSFNNWLGKNTGSAAGKPCEQGQSAKQTGCIADDEDDLNSMSDEEKQERALMLGPTQINPSKEGEKPGPQHGLESNKASDQVKNRIKPFLIDQGAISVKVESDKPKAKKLAEAAEAALKGIPNNMRVAGGSSSRVTITDKVPSGVSADTDAFFQSGGVSPGGYLKVLVRSRDPESFHVTVVHEYGHAVDRWLGIKSGIGRNVSDHEEFQKAFEEDVASMNDRDRYFHSHATSKPVEGFAEVYAHLTGANRFAEYPNAPQVLDIFPRAAAWIRSLFEEIA